MKKIIALLLCVLMVLGMAACANTTTDAATNSDSTADTAKTDTADTTSADTAEDNTASDDVVTITYSYWGTPDEAASVQAVADKFHEEYPNILVEVMAIPNEEYVTKLNTLATANNLPDCGIMNESGVLDFASDGLLYDISDMYAGAESMPLDSITFKADGAPVAYSAANEVLSLYYNKDMFREAGLDAENPPATMEELYAAWDKLIQKDGNGNVTQYAQAIGVKSTVAMMPVFMWAYGADYIKDGKSVLDSDEATAAMTMIADAYAKGVSPVGLTGQEADDLFAAGKAAIEFNGQWAAPGFRSSARISFFISFR